MKKDRKKIPSLLFSIIMVCCLCLLSGCGSRKSGKIDDSMAKHHVCLIGKSSNTQFWNSLYAGAEAAAAEYNVDLTILAPERQDDYIAQKELIRKASEYAEVIILSAIDYEECAEVVEEAYQKGVYVITVDSQVKSDVVTTHIGTNNYEAGVTAAEAALHCDYPEISLMIVTFGQRTENLDDRFRGINDAIAAEPRITDVNTVNIKEENAAMEEQIEEAIRQNPKTNVLIATNQLTSVTLSQVVQKLNLGEKTWLVGFDSSVEMVDMLHSGEVDALILQNPYAMGYLGVEQAYKGLNGQFKGEPGIETVNTPIYRENMYEMDNQKLMFSIDNQ